MGIEYTIYHADCNYQYENYTDIDYLAEVRVRYLSDPHGEHDGEERRKSEHSR